MTWLVLGLVLFLGVHSTRIFADGWRSAMLSNGRLADVVLFGAFLARTVVLFIVSRRRDRAAGVAVATPSALRTVIVAVLGTVIWAAFAFKLHTLLIGVAPFAR